MPGYEGLYEVSSYGRIRSLPRQRRGGRSGNGMRTVRERILKPKPGKYPAVSLRRCADPMTFNVHTLVLLAFVGPCPDGMEACHGDGNKWNCNLGNLRWDTPSSNHDDRVRHGVSNRGERCGTAKLTEAQVGDIRSLYAAGRMTQAVLAARYGVAQSQISHIINRKRWSYGENS